MNLSNTKCDKLSFYEEKIRWRMRRQISNAEAIFYENQEEHIQRFFRQIYLPQTGSCLLGK